MTGRPPPKLLIAPLTTRTDVHGGKYGYAAWNCHREIGVSPALCVRLTANSFSRSCP